MNASLSRCPHAESPATKQLHQGRRALEQFGTPTKPGVARGRSLAASAPVKRSCACGGGCPRCKGLVVSEPGDPLEREADRVAERALAGRSPAGPWDDIAPRAFSTPRGNNPLTAPSSVTGAVPPAVRNVVRSAGASL